MSTGTYIPYPGSPRTPWRRLLNAARFGGIRSRRIVGKYQRVPVENDWHRGEIVWLGDHQFAWKNEAGSEWRLTPDLNNSRLLKSVGSDYYDLPKGKELTLKLKIGRQIPADYTEIADWDTIELGSVLGFSHAGEYFERTGDL